MTTATIRQILPKSRYNNHRRQAIRDGEWQNSQPAANVRAHIDALRNGPARLRIDDIVDRSGVPYSTVKNLMYSGAETVTGYVASRILAVTADQPGDWKHIDATGTRRRIQALAWMQWGQPQIGAHLGVCGRAVSELLRRPLVHEDTAAKVRQVYDQLGSTLGPSTRARARAERLGWCGPLAWDDDTIDDPNAQPVLDAEPTIPDAYDPITVGLAIDGRLTHAQIAAHKPDLIETVRRLATRMTDQQIADHLRWPGADDGPIGRTRGQNAVNQLRNREGIPAMPKPALAVPHPSTRIRRARRARQAA